MKRGEERRKERIQPGTNKVVERLKKEGRKKREMYGVECTVSGIIYRKK